MDIDILVGLERTLDVQAQVLSLDVGELGELCIDVSQVQGSDFLVQNFGEDIDADGKLFRLGKGNIFLAKGSIFSLVQHDLGKNLVAEGARHDERGVTSGTSKVDKTALGEKDDVTAVGQKEAVDLRLDVLDALGVRLQPGNINFNIEMANVYRKS